MIDLDQKICISPYCEDTERFMSGNQCVPDLHGHCGNFIVSVKSVLEDKQLDIINCSQKKLSDFTQVLLASQKHLKNEQIYKENYDEFHYFMIEQCLRISQYYQSFDNTKTELRIKELLLHFQNLQIHKKEFLRQLNFILKLNYLLESRVYNVIFEAFNKSISAEELSLQTTNKDTLLQYLQSKFNEIIQMRATLILNLIPYELSQHSQTSSYNLRYLQVVCLIFIQERVALEKLQNLNSKQNYSLEMISVEQLKTNLINSLLSQANYFTNQYDIQSTFSAFYEIYQIDVFNKPALRQLQESLQKFNFQLEKKNVSTLSLITFPRDLEIIEECLNCLYPQLTNKEDLLEKLKSKIEMITISKNEKILFENFAKIFQENLKDSILINLFHELIQEGNLSAIIQKLFRNLLNNLKNNYYKSDIPKRKLLQTEVDKEEVFSYTSQKQADRKEKQFQEENEKKKEQEQKEQKLKLKQKQKKKEHKKKQRKNILEIQFESFKKNAKQRRNVLSCILSRESDEKTQELSPTQVEIEQAEEHKTSNHEDISLIKMEDNKFQLVNKSLDDEKNLNNELFASASIDHLQKQQSQIQLVPMEALYSIQSTNFLITESEAIQENPNKVEEVNNQSKPVKTLKFEKISSNEITLIKAEDLNQKKNNKQQMIIDLTNETKQTIIFIDNDEIEMKMEFQENQSIKNVQNNNTMQIEDDQNQQHTSNENQEMNDLTQNEEDTKHYEALCNNLCENPLDQESFLKLFKQINNEALISLCTKYKEIQSLPLKQELYSQLSNFFSASIFFYLNNSSLSKQFLSNSLKYQYCNAHRLNQLGFFQLKIKQHSSALQNFENSVKISNHESQWLAHAQLGFLYHYIYHATDKATFHYMQSINKKQVEVSFFLLFQIGIIYYHNFRHYNAALLYFNQSFSFISKNKLKSQISNEYFTETILDFALLNYRVNNLKQSKSSIDFFYSQQPKQNHEIAQYLESLIQLKLGNYLIALDILQKHNFDQSKNVSMQIEYLMLLGYISLVYIYDEQNSITYYKQAWQLIDSQNSYSSSQKRLRILKQLITTRTDDSFISSCRTQFMLSSSKNEQITYLEFLFQYGVSNFNKYLTKIKSESQSLVVEWKEEVFQRSELMKLIEVFRVCMEYSHRKMDCLYMIGKCFKDLLGDDVESIHCFTSLLEMNPLNYPCQIQVLELCVLNNRFEQAKQIIKQLQNLKMETPQMIYLEGKMFQKQGLFQKSLELYLKLFDNKQYTLPIPLFQLLQKDYAYCSFKLQEYSFQSYLLE